MKFKALHGNEAMTTPPHIHKPETIEDKQDHFISGIKTGGSTHQKES